MSVTTSRLMTLEKYLRFDEPVDGKDELIEGELFISPSAFPDHMEVAHQLQALLARCLEGKGYVVRQDMSILVEKTEPASMPRPDVFVLPEAQWRDCVHKRAWPEGSSILAIEIFSPSNRRPSLRKKIDLFLRGGSSAVWVIYPARRVVQVCTSVGDREYRLGESIPLPDPLPSHQISVMDVFATLI